MLKKVLCVVLSLVLALGAMSVGVFAATADEIAEAVALLPTDYNAQFYNDETIAAIQAAKAAAAAGADNAVELCEAAYALVTEEAYDAYDAPYFVNRDESKAVVNYNINTDVSKVKPGDTFDVTLTVQTNFAIGSGRISLAYDNRVLEIVETTHPTEMETYIKYLSPNYDFMNPDNSDLVPMEWLYDDNGEAAIDNYNLFSLVFACNASVAPKVWFPQDAADEFCTITFKVKDDAADGVAKIFADDTLNCSYFEYETDEYFLEDLLGFNRANDSEVYPSTYTPNYEGGSYANGATAYDVLAMYDQTTVYGGTGAEAYTSTDVYGGREVTVNGVAINVEIASTKPADYTKLEAAIAEAGNYSANDWTAETYGKLEDAVKAANECSRDLTEEQQATVDALEAAIYAAIEGLERQQAAGCPIESITANGEIKLLQYANLSVVVKNAPAMKLRFVNSNGGSMTYATDNVNVKSITDNGDGTETWIVSVPASKLEETYTVYVRYADTGWNEVGYVYDMVAVDPEVLDDRFISWDIVDDYEGAIYNGVNTITVVTGLDVSKVQFMNKKGNTWTFTGSNSTFVDADGVRTWTLKMNFSALGDQSYDIRTRTVKSTFTSTGEKMDVTVFQK